MRSPLKKKDRAIVENFPTSSPRSRRVVFPGMEFHATTTTPAIAHNGCGPPYRGGSFPAGKKWIPMETDYTPASISNVPRTGDCLGNLGQPSPTRHEECLLLAREISHTACHEEFRDDSAASLLHTNRDAFKLSKVEEPRLLSFWENSLKVVLWILKEISSESSYENFSWKAVHLHWLEITNIIQWRRMVNNKAVLEFQSFHSVNSHLNLSFFFRTHVSKQILTFPLFIIVFARINSCLLSREAFSLFLLNTLEWQKSNQVDLLSNHAWNLVRTPSTHHRFVPRERSTTLSNICI